MRNLTTIAALPIAGGCMAATNIEVTTVESPGRALMDPETGEVTYIPFEPMTPYWAEQLDIPNPAQLRTLAAEQKAD